MGTCFFRVRLFLFTLFGSCFVGLALPALAQTLQNGFDTPQQAADRLIQAAESFNVPALKQILGPDSEDLVSSEDAVQDKIQAETLVAMAREKNSIAHDPKNVNRATLLIGNENWPFPIPIVKRQAKWYFDSKGGRSETLRRRIGANELEAISICHGLVKAEEEYAAHKHDDSDEGQYAQRIISTPGKHDGLAWKNLDGNWGGPVGETIAEALKQGYSATGQQYHGYYYKMLKGQGPAAPNGQMDFVAGGATTRGFALVAAPAEYKITGVRTFIVSHSGVVYQNDLGPDTLNIFKNMERFNPDATWQIVHDEWPQ